MLYDLFKVQNITRNVWLKQWMVIENRENNHSSRTNAFPHHLHQFCGTSGIFYYFLLFFCKIWHILYFSSVKL